MLSSTMQSYPEQASAPHHIDNMQQTGGMLVCVVFLSLAFPACSLCMGLWLFLYRLWGILSRPLPLSSTSLQENVLSTFIFWAW